MFRLLILLVIIIGLGVLGKNLFFTDNSGDFFDQYTDVEIGELTNDAFKFDGKLVQIKGMVARNAGVFGFGGFIVEDTSGSILVIGVDGIPPNGQKVTVSGLFKQAFTTGNASYSVIVANKVSEF